MRILASAVVLVGLAGPTVALAQTSGQAQSCTPDALRLCGAYIPDRALITRCLASNRPALSPACRRELDAGMRPRSRKRRSAG